MVQHLISLVHNNFKYYKNEKYTIHNYLDYFNTL